MSHQPFKICLVGLSVELKKIDILNYLKSVFPSSELSLEMKLRANGKNQGWAVLNTKDKKLYRKVLDAQEFCLKGKKFFAKRYLQPEELKKFQGDFNRRRVFIKSIPRRVTSEQLVDFFRVYGELEDGYIVQNSNSKFGLNYGFLVFKHIEDARNLVKFNRINFYGKFLIVEKFRSKKNKGKNLEKTKRKNFSGKKVLKIKHKKKSKKFYKGRIASGLTKDGQSGHRRGSGNRELEELLTKEQHGRLNHYESHDLSRARMGLGTYKQICRARNLPIITPYIVNYGVQSPEEEDRISPQISPETSPRLLRGGHYPRKISTGVCEARMSPQLDFNLEEESSASKAIAASVLLTGHVLSNLRFGGPRGKNGSRNLFDELGRRENRHQRDAYGW